MGLETALLVVAGVAEAGKIGSQFAAADAQENALNLQAKEMQVQAQQKTLSNYDVMQKVLDAQEAQMTVRGTAFSSPSFNAIQRETLNVGDKKFKNIKIEGDIAQQNIDNEKSNVRSKLYAQLFGDASDIAMAGMNMSRKMPTMGE